MIRVGVVYAIVAWLVMQVAELRRKKRPAFEFRAKSAKSVRALASRAF